MTVLLRLVLAVGVSFGMVWYDDYCFVDCWLVLLFVVLVFLFDSWFLIVLVW